MTDIVERLRKYDHGPSVETVHEAAAEIERLRAVGLDLLGVVDQLRPAYEQLRDEIVRLQAALERIEQWSQAYPLSVFPDPDLKKAAAVLKANGMTLDAISAHAMRHVVEGVGKIAREALQDRGEA